MRLIDADALKTEIRRAVKEYKIRALGPQEYCEGFAEGLNTVADLIVDAATTVEERKHGHWYTGFYFEKHKHAECSVCGYGNFNCNPYWKYCPNCGATMDEVVKNERTC